MTPVPVAIGLSLILGSPTLVLGASDHPVAGPGGYHLHPSLELSLYAREPDVVDPVALTFDKLGRAYVVEMRDYPYGFGPDRRPGGTVRRLEDADGDGRADRSVLFAETLSFPTSITAWDGGVLVTAPPDILFLKDTDGDGRADLRETWITGFKLGVTDSNANGLRFGLDSWIHGVNGGNGGALRFRGSTGDPVNLGDRDFRFQPLTGGVEPTAHTGGGFGLVFDEWGRSFTPHNINHLQQRVVEAGYFLRFPGLPPVETTHSISDHGEMARIYAISPAQTRPNHPEQAGHFSAAGGMGYLGHQGWPAELHASALVCDVVGNLVHRDVLVPDGPIRRATRAPEEQQSEFFASRDNAFRPVGLELGPDGSLYLLDMQRDVIEHPDYIPKKTLEKQNIRAGDDRGRIYRITPKNRDRLVRSLREAGTLDPGHPDRERLPGRATPVELVRLLGSPNPWTRQTAQRLLVTGPGRRVAFELRRQASPEGSANPLARLHALMVLHALDTLPAPDSDRQAPRPPDGFLPESLLLDALDDPSPGVRVHAVRLAEARLAGSPKLAAAVAERATDPSIEVRFRVALAAGFLPAERGNEVVLRILAQDHGYSWSRRAALASIQGRDWNLPLRLLALSTNQVVPDALQEIWSVLAARLGANDAAALETAMNQMADWTEDRLRLAALNGLEEGLARSSTRLVAGPAVRDALAGFTEPPALLAAAWRVGKRLGFPVTQAQTAALEQAMRSARDTGADLGRRIEASRLLGLGELSRVAPTLFALLDGREPSVLQRAALEVLRAHREPEVGRGLVRAWPSLAPTLRPDVVNLLVYRHAFHEALLDALESGALQVGELNLDLEHRRQLLRHAAPELRTRAAKFMSDEEYSNRNAVVEDWLARLPAAGEATRGRGVFERICAQCHVAGGFGHAVGPELTGMNHRSVEDLLSNILDPNMAMNPAYVAYTVDLADGEQESGILGPEAPGVITLLQAQGRQVQIPRSQVKQLRSGGRSLMPEGLEAGLTPQDLRDLIAFLQQPAGTAPAPGGAP